MRRVKEEGDEAAGQDSFLDVVTNIVGILILLVMVVGLRSSHAVATAQRPGVEQAAAAADQLQEALETATQAQRQVRDALYRAAAAVDETQIRQQERAILQQMVTEAEQEIAAQRANLGEHEQRDFDLRRQLTEAQIELDQLSRQQIALLSRDEPVEQIECEPTPLGKVVTGREVHCLLSDDHLAIVPFDELLERIKEDFANNAWRLKDQDEIERTVGPVRGFRARYWMIRKNIVAEGRAGSVMAGTVSTVSHCYFLPVAEPAGEPAELALRPESEFGRFLQRQRPGTTITLWTHPGNYERLRELKSVVRAANLPVAVWPLEAGKPIGASSSGSASIGQ